MKSQAETKSEPDFTTAGTAGALIAMRLADEIAYREVTRIRQYLVAKELEAHHVAYPNATEGRNRLEVMLADRFRDVHDTSGRRTLLAPPNFSKMEGFPS